MDEATFSRYDAADYLKTEEDLLLYLEAAMETDDAAVITCALGAIARARNISELARKTGLSREGIYQALSGNGNPSLSTILKISRALGLRFQAVQAL